jgi:GWxTD domain-containing protein
MTFRFVLTAIFFILFSSSGFQQIAHIPLSVDYATFNSPKGNAYLEIYVSFHQTHIRYVQSDSGYVAEVAINTEIFSEDSMVTSYSKNYHSTLASPDQIQSQHQIMDVYFFELPFGKYTANIKVNDVYSMATGEYVFNFNMTPLKKNELSLSDIELCNNISQNITYVKFQKGNLQVIPNPSTLYGFSLPVLYYYAEAYNLAFTKSKEGTFRQESYITDAQGAVIKVISDEIKQKPGSSSVLVGGSNIAGLPGNTYFLNLKVTDQQTGKIAKKTKRFTLVKPSDKSSPDTTTVRASSQNILLAIYMNYEEEDLDREFEQARYISSAEEKKLYPQLDLKGKRQFLMNFWEKRDSDPNTAENEFRNDYLQRVMLISISAPKGKAGRQTAAGYCWFTAPLIT